MPTADRSETHQPHQRSSSSPSYRKNNTIFYKKTKQDIYYLTENSVQTVCTEKPGPAGSQFCESKLLETESKLLFKLNEMDKRAICNNHFQQLNLIQCSAKCIHTTSTFSKLSAHQNHKHQCSFSIFCDRPKQRTIMKTRRWLHHAKGGVGGGGAFPAWMMEVKCSRSLNKHQQNAPSFYDTLPGS